MNVTRTDNGNETTIKLEGVMSDNDVPAVKAVFDAVVAEKRPSVIVDLSLLNDMDLDTVSIFSYLTKKHLSDNFGLKIIGARGKTRDVFSETRLQRLLAD